jgi:hypothetical protein
MGVTFPLVEYVSFLYTEIIKAFGVIRDQNHRKLTESDEGWRTPLSMSAT